MSDGIIYPTFVLIVRILRALNIVEHVKTLFAFAYGLSKRRELNAEETIRAKNIAIDIFQVFKWLLILIFFARAVDGIVATAVVGYLVFFNIFTYFYYHVWKSDFTQRDDLHSQRRRFLNFLLAVAFFVVSYAYLYQYSLAGHIVWPDGAVSTANAIYISISNAFTLSYGDFSPLTQSSRVVFISELVNTFFFFTIIVANSIPSISNRKE